MGVALIFAIILMVAWMPLAALPSLKTLITFILTGEGLI